MIWLGLTGCGDDPARWPATPFDQAKWAQAQERQRFVFARDLMRTKSLIGLRREQVLQRLGAPSFDDGGTGYITYVIKADGGTVHLLDIRFSGSGPDQVVTDVLIRAD